MAASFTPRAVAPRGAALRACALACAIGALAAPSVSACGRDAAEPAGRAELQPPQRHGDELEGRVRAKLVSDPRLSGAGSIVVIADRGHVLLEGWIASSTERALAEADVTTVAGVMTIDDRLLIRGL